MEAMQIQAYARRLFEALGPKAIAVAAQKALMFDRGKDPKQARVWRRIEAALLLRRGPRRR